MNDDRKIIIQFNYGTKMEVSFPTQIKNSTAAVQEALKRIMESDKLAIQTEGELLVIPWTSVQYLKVAPAPSAMPFGTIKNAKVVV